MRSFMAGALLVVFIIAFFVWFVEQQPKPHPTLTYATVLLLQDRFPLGKIINKNEYYQVCSHGEFWKLYEDGEQAPANKKCWIE